jgi:hypothetical protein
VGGDGCHRNDTDFLLQFGVNRAAFATKRAIVAIILPTSAPARDRPTVARSGRSVPSLGSVLADSGNERDEFGLSFG